MLLPLALAAEVILTSCGGEPRVVDQASPKPPLQSVHVAVTQTGDGGAAIAAGSVRLRLDDARLLVVDVRVRSIATTARSIALRATAEDASGRVVGEATGGAVRVAPGSEIALELSGPTPSGVIAAVTIEVRTTPAPSATPVP